MAESTPSAHQWHFAGRLSLKISDAPAPAANRDAARLDPLKSYVATFASARMLAWLHVAFRHEVEVETYLDTALRHHFPSKTTSAAHELGKAL